MSARGFSGRCRAPMGPRRRPAGCCSSSALRARSGPAPASRCGCRPPRRRGCWCRPRHWSMRKRAPTSIAVTARVTPSAFTMRRCRCGRCRGWGVRGWSRDSRPTIVRSSLAARGSVTALSLLVALLGTGALLGARLDVFPDFAPPHVLVQVEAPGLDATQAESLVTRPLEGLLAGAESIAAIRSTSSQGLSAIQVVFGAAGDPYRQRQVITERLAQAGALLPAGAGPPLL